MKKILLGSAVLTCFAFAITILQISCQKTVDAQSSSYVLQPATTTTLGGVIVGSGLSVTSAGVLSVTPSSSGSILNKLIFKKNFSGTIPPEIWTANYDGTGAAKVNINLPSGIIYSDNMNPAMSPNGTKIFFTAGSSGQYYGDLYSCNVDGSSVTKIVDRGSANDIILGGAY
jgi:Tol biopolymer transport system component